MGNKSNDIGVSVMCITYNHVGLIRKCLDGIVMQETNFPFEVWIHDDCSTDGTIDVLKEYEAKYPNIINVIYEEENQYSQGLSFSEKMIPHQVGKYVATCEGDDYWTDPHKLQKQYDFMESHQDVTLCAHAAKEINLENGVYFKRPSDKESKYVNMEIIIQNGGGYFPTCSFFTRNTFEIIINRWGKGICGDFNKILHAGLNGKVYYMNECMAVKTVFYPGSWSSTHKNIDLMCKHIENEIESIELFNKDTNYKYDLAVKKLVQKYNYQLNCEFRGNNKLLFTDDYYREIYKTLPKNKKIRAFLLSYMKPIYVLYSKIKPILIKIKCLLNG